MARRCSHCGNNGHNSRTCREKGVKLFGVTLKDGCIRMSMSMENLANCSSATQNSSSPTDNNSESIPAAADGYLSEETTQEINRGRERKKGIPWTMEEHRMFLEGLKKLGKGDWRGISKGFVTTRTPTQVASHAQKYFMRQCNSKKPKRRSSLFDITPHTDASEFLGEEASVINNEGSETMTRLSLSRNQYASSDLTSPVIPLSFPLWPSEACSKPPSSSSIVKPIAILPTGPIKIDISKENSELKLSISPPPIESSSLSLKLSDYHSRNSAFHENASFSKNADLSNSGNAIKVL